MIQRIWENTSGVFEKTRLVQTASIYHAFVVAHQQIQAEAAVELLEIGIHVNLLYSKLTQAVSGA